MKENRAKWEDEGRKAERVRFDTNFILKTQQQINKPLHPKGIVSPWGEREGGLCQVGSQKAKGGKGSFRYHPRLKNATTP
jgi:hypothetical protein